MTTLAVVHALERHHCHHCQPGSNTTTAMERISEDEPLHCGNSVEEAIALGCTFDPMMLMWLRPECSRTGTDEYMEFLNGTLNYWVDHEGRIPVADLSRQVNDDGFWGEQKQHLAHCAFVYVRLVEAATTDNIALMCS